MKQQHLREFLWKPEHPQPMTIKDLMQFLYHAFRVLIKKKNCQIFDYLNNKSYICNRN